MRSGPVTESALDDEPRDTHDLEDAELVERIRDGDGSAMRRLLEKYHRLVIAVCRRQLGKLAEAEDVAQNVFLRVFKHLHTWDGSRPLKPWLLAITVNQCRTTRKRVLKRPDHLPLQFDGGSTDARYRAEEVREEILVALNTLRPEYRRAFELFYEQQMSLEEVAAHLQRPIGTIKTWLHRARNEMAEHLRRRGWNYGSPHQTSGSDSDAL
ncbi:MAG: RNA polymerase sigma factor [Planctomycetota bacterium]|nr:MAG: RNA polymerase sigma factor [Planctomycetota bacterium]